MEMEAPLFLTLGPSNGSDLSEVNMVPLWNFSFSDKLL